MKRIILTGGGTAGHVTPNIALLPRLRELGYDIHYIGSYTGMERRLIESVGLPYHGISSGKLRRYFAVKNFTDPFRVMKGGFDAYSLLRKLKPDIVFSKGGFVTVPVVMAAKLHGIPVILHESDISPGLANRLSFPAATKVCCNFPETLASLPRRKAVLTGSPIRQELHLGNPEAAKRFTGLDGSLPILLVIGGSLGSVAINNSIRAILPTLLTHFQVIHLCGKGNLDPTCNHLQGYVQYEYIQEELKDLFAFSSLVISRAGANAICELLALRKPNLLIPLPAKSSRGDQILNAASFEKQGFSKVLSETAMTPDTLLSAILALYENRKAYESTMASSTQQNSVETIVQLIEATI